MAEHQHLDPGAPGAVCGLRRAGMIVQDIVHDLPRLHPPGGLQPVGEHLHHLRLQRFVNQQVGPLRGALERCRCRGVAADHDAAPLIVEAIADRGLDRTMVDRKGGHRQAVRVIDHRWRGGHGKGEGNRPGGGGRRDRGAVMRGAITVVERIGRIEPRDHRFDPRRSADGERGLVAARCPAQQHHRPHPVDMIRMIMGQEQPAYLRVGKAHQRNVARAALAGVDDEHGLARNDHGAGAGTLAVGQRRPGAAERDVQPVGQARQPVARDVAFDGTVEQPQPDRPLEQKRRRHRDCGNRQHEQRQAPALGHWSSPTRFFHHAPGKGAGQARSFGAT